MTTKPDHGTHKLWYVSVALLQPLYDKVQARINLGCLATNGKRYDRVAFQACNNLRASTLVASISICTHLCTHHTSTFVVWTFCSDGWSSSVRISAKHVCTVYTLDWYAHYAGSKRNLITTIPTEREPWFEIVTNAEELKTPKCDETFSLLLTVKTSAKVIVIHARPFACILMNMKTFNSRHFTGLIGKFNEHTTWSTGLPATRKQIIASHVSCTQSIQSVRDCNWISWTPTKFPAQPVQPHKLIWNVAVSDNSLATNITITCISYGSSSNPRYWLDSKRLRIRSR